MDQSPAAAAQRLAFNEWEFISAVKTGDTETIADLIDGGVPVDTKDDEGGSLLHLAARRGHVTTMRLLIRRGCDVDSVDGKGLTPLHCAAAMGQTKAVRELIRKGASKSVVVGNFGTPLHQAALNGHVETAVAMLEEGCPLYVVSGAGATVLHSAAAGGNVEIMKELVGRGCNINAVKADGCTPLHSAAGHGRTKAVLELIKLGAAKSVVVGNCGTPLHQAALSGHVETAVAMLEEGCPLDVVRSDGDTVLHWAASGGNVELVKELVVRGCDVNAVKANGCTPLHDAAGRGRTEAVRELIKLGAAKSVVGGKCGTPLHQAVFNGHLETAVAMLKTGCPIDVVNSAGATVLHWAAEGGYAELVRELVGRGCDMNAVEADGCTPLHSAAGRGRTEAVHELIKLGAAKSVVGGNCGTPLHQAALNGHVETAVAMLEKGCPIDVVNSVGATVLHFAASGGNVELVRELVGRGCNVNAMETNGCTPLHSAAGCGRTEAVHELIKLGAAKSVVAGNCGTPLHQAVLNGHLETVEDMLQDSVSDTDMSKDDLIATCTSFGITPVMSAGLYGQVEVFKFLISRGGNISNRDIFSLCAFEHCIVGGHASKLNLFCEASGIRSSGEGLRGVLATLITRGLVDAHKVLCLCAISGDILFLEDQFIELVASDACAMPAAVKCAKLYFENGEGISFISQLKIPDESTLNPLHISLLSLKCYEMGFAIGSLQRGAKDHTSFITKLLSHPVLKETVHENFPNGLSPLDLARQFELHHIAALIEGAGGHPLKKVCDPSQGGHEAVKKAVMKLLGAQTVERSPPGPWHPNAMIVGANVGPETDEHEYKSLMVPADKTKKPPPMCPCKDTSEVLKKVDNHKKEINAMLNHHTGGTVHFGIHNGGMVEEGLDLHQTALIDKLQTRVGQLLQEFYPAVQSRFVTIQPVNLANRSEEPTGRWRFDICVTPHDKVVLLSRHQTVTYYRQGGNSEPMPANMLMERLRADDSRLVKEHVLGQRPDLGDVVTHVLPHIQVRSKWKIIGLALGIKKSTLDQFTNEDDPYLETLSYWLEHGSSVTWKTLLDVLGHFETKHTLDELADKIVSVLGGGDQVVAVSGPFRPVSTSVPVVSGGAVAAERSPPVCEAKQVLGDFRGQFIADVDANTVVWELLHKNIIPRGVQERISRTDEPEQRNEILHDCLQRTCTKEALMKVCDIIVAVRGHPKMRELGEAMKRRMHTGTPDHHPSR